MKGVGEFRALKDGRLWRGLFQQFFGMSQCPRPVTSLTLIKSCFSQIRKVQNRSLSAHGFILESFSYHFAELLVLTQSPSIHSCSHESILHNDISKTPDHETPLRTNTSVALHCQGLWFIIPDLPVAYQSLKNKRAKWYKPSWNGQRFHGKKDKARWADYNIL